MKTWLHLMIAVLGVATSLSQPACGGDDDMPIDEADADVMAPDADPNAPDAAPKPDADPNAPTYTADIQPILSSQMAGCFGCHGSSTGLLSYSNLTTKTANGCGGLKLVDTATNDPAKSALYKKVSAADTTIPGCGSRMPLNKNPLSASDIATIEAWITAGSPQ